MQYAAVDLVAVALPAALLLRGRRPARHVLPAGLLLAGLALVWTAPWDEHLVRSGVWSYAPGAVLATAGSVPVEEYAFVVLLVGLVVAWGTRAGLLDGAPAGSAGSRVAGAAGWAAVALVGLGLLLAGGGLRYLGLLLVWAAPPLSLQHAVAGDLLGGLRSRRLLLALPVALWLCVVDRTAIGLGIWSVTPASSTGLLVLGLPVEEALFFLLTCLLVADGLLLALDGRARARAGRLLTGAAPGAGRTVSR